MKRKTLLLLVMTSFIIAAQAQKKQKQQPLTGYAITAAEKGGRSWKEVKFVDIASGQELKSIYQSTKETEPLNARTGKPVVKSNVSSDNAETRVFTTTTTSPTPALGSTQPSRKKVVNLDEELNKVQGNTNNNVNVNNNYNVNNNVNVHVTTNVKTRVVVIGRQIQKDKPFATNSAAMAYDKKHERLYYTPMNINELRYIDLKTNQIYYFENEPFGTVSGFGDAGNQITRMVIASDGNGYALSNDANHLIRFTTGKNPVITDLGALSDDANNGKFSVHSGGGYGGDIIADHNENLYLITANRNVFKIPINNKLATYQGTIKGLPKGFSTNGAMVEEGSKVIVASSESTEGYFRFDLTTMQAERVSQEGAVFNASDLANANLAFDKKKKKDREKAEVPAKPEEPTAPEVAAKQQAQPTESRISNGIAIYPNPVLTNSPVRVSFADQPTGKYQVQLLDLAGQLISSQEVNIASKSQVVNFNIPEVAKGSYLIKVVGTANGVRFTNKLVVQ
jgi:hypothetical protein